MASVEERVVRAAEDALAVQHHVSLTDVLIRLQWLAQSHIDRWRQGRVEYLEEWVQAGPAKQVTAMRTFQEWARERGLEPQETKYVARTADRRTLRFSAIDQIEQAYRIQWISPELSPKKADAVRAKTSAAPELVVVAALKDWTCGRCGVNDEDLLLMQDDMPLCLRCVGLDHLVFLPSGDAGRTRRAHKASALSAVVVRFSRTRRRYERQGLLVEPAALEAADAATTPRDTLTR